MMSNELLKRKILDSIYNNKDNNYVIEKVIKVFDIVGGSQPPKSQFSEDEKDGYVRLYQTRDYGEKPVPVYVEKNSVSKFTKKGDILLARYGGSLGKVFIAEEGAYNVALAKVIIKDSKRFYNKFVYYYFLSSKYQNFTKSLSKMAQAGFNKNDLSDLTIIIPPLEEQEKIVKKIEELFELIDKKEKNDKEKEKLKTLLKEKILDSAIHGELVKNDLSLPAIDVEEEKADIPFNIPSNWKYTYLNNVGIWKAGSTPLKDNLDYYRDGNIPWVLTGDLNDGILSTCKHYITEKAFNECSLKLNKIGSVLIAMYGATIGKVAINSMKVTTNQACCACECYDKIIYNKYLFYYLIGIREELKAKAEGAGQPNISKQKIINYKILLPPLEQQKKIVEKIEECFKLIEQL